METRLRTGFEELHRWCNEVVLRKYQLSVANFSTDWRNGLAFCALVHHLNPAAIDLSTISERNAVSNLRLAFDLAAKLGVYPLLDVEDVIDADPDQNSIATYILQFYNLGNGISKDVEDEADLVWDEDEEVDVLSNTEAMMKELFQRKGTNEAAPVSPRKASNNNGPLSPRKATDSLNELLAWREGDSNRKGTKEQQPAPLSPRGGRKDLVLSGPQSGSGKSTALSPPVSPRHSPSRIEAEPPRPPPKDAQSSPPGPDAPQRTMMAIGRTRSSAVPSVSAGSNISVALTPASVSSPPRPSPKPPLPPPARPAPTARPDSPEVSQGKTVPSPPPKNAELDTLRSLSPSKRGVGFKGVSSVAHAWTPAPEIRAPTSPLKSILRDSSPHRQLVTPEDEDVTMPHHVRRRSDAVFDDMPPVVDPYTGQIVAVPGTGSSSSSTGPGSLRAREAREAKEAREEKGLALFIDLSDVTRDPGTKKAEEPRMGSPTGRRKSVRGLLYKQDPDGNLIQGWKKRWFYLKDGRLFYYLEEGDTPISFISLRTVLSVGLADGKKNTLCIVTTKRHYNLKAESREVMMHWLEELRMSKEQVGLTDSRADHKYHKEGMLMEGSNAKSLKRRFAYIHGGFLYVLEAPGARDRKLKLPLLGAKITPLPLEIAGVTSAFEIRNGARTVLCAADSPLEQDDWVLCLKQAKLIVEAQIKSIRRTG